MKPGDATYVFVPLADFLKMGAELKENHRKWKFTGVELEYQSVWLTITSGAGILTVPARGSIRASASLTARNFLRIFNSLGKATTGE